MIKYLRRALAQRRARRWAKKFGPPVLSTPWLQPTPWDAWRLDDDQMDALRHSVAMLTERITADLAKWNVASGPASALNRRDYRERMDRAAAAARSLADSESPENQAVQRALEAWRTRQQRNRVRPATHYVYGEPVDVPGEATVELSPGGPVLKAHSIRIVPIREITTTEGEGS